MNVVRVGVNGNLIRINMTKEEFDKFLKETGYRKGE